MNHPSQQFSHALGVLHYTPATCDRDNPIPMRPSIPRLSRPRYLAAALCRIGGFARGLQRAIPKPFAFRFPSTKSPPNQNAWAFTPSARPTGSINPFAIVSAQGLTQILIDLMHSPCDRLSLHGAFSLFGLAGSFWEAALSPATAYLGALGANSRREPLTLDAGELNRHIAMLGTTGSGMSMTLATFLRQITPPEPEAQASRVPTVDQIGMIEPWPIGSDEDLGPGHPMLAMAFFGGLAAADDERHSDRGAFERAARLLAEALAGAHGSLDGIDPLWLDGLEGSEWARTQAPNLMAAAQPILRSLVERRAIDLEARGALSPSAASQATPGRSGPRQAMRL